MDGPEGRYRRWKNASNFSGRICDGCFRARSRPSEGVIFSRTRSARAHYISCATFLAAAPGAEAIAAEAHLKHRSAAAFREGGYPRYGADSEGGSTMGRKDAIEN